MDCIMKLNGFLDYLDGSSDRIEMKKFIIRKEQSIAYEFITSWSEEGSWCFSGVANYDGNKLYKTKKIRGKLAVDKSVEEKEEADIEFEIIDINQEHCKVEINGKITYGSDEFRFEGLLEEGS